MQFPPSRVGMPEQGKCPRLSAEPGAFDQPQLTSAAEAWSASKTAELKEPSGAPQVSLSVEASSATPEEACLACLPVAEWPFPDWMSQERPRAAVLPVHPVCPERRASAQRPVFPVLLGRGEAASWGVPEAAACPSLQPVPRRRSGPTSPESPGDPAGRECCACRTPSATE